MPENRSRRLLPLGLAAALFLLGVAATLYGPAGAPYSSEHAEGLDDAYITYRYAANLLEGHGLVFNPGERIEGYSNLLWVLVSAGLLLFWPAPLIHYAVCFFTAFLAALSVLVLESEMRRRHGGTRALAAAALWAAYPFLWQWISSGLEAVAVVLLQLLLWRTLSRARDRQAFPWLPIAAWLSLLVLLRADGFVMVALAAGHFLLDRRPAWALRTLAAGAPAVIGLFAFRLAYFQDVWPSTYYVKIAQPIHVRALAGLERLAELLFDFLLAPFLLVLLWLAWRTFEKLRGDRGFAFPPELSLAFGLLAYWIYIGGDHFRIRFLLVLFPLALAAIFGPLADGLPRDRKALMALALLTLFAGTVWGAKDFRWRKDRYDGWIELGLFLGKHYPGKVLAAEAIGKTPYFSGLYTIDMLGLCDAHISKLPPVRQASPGHEKSDGAYVLGRRPDLIAGHLRPDFSVAPDLDAASYQAAGYRLAFLANMANESHGEGQDIIPAPATREAIWMHVFRGYSYAILVREGTSPAAPAGGPTPAAADPQ